MCPISRSGAARNGRLETVEWCLAVGVDPNVLYESDKTALHFAAYNDDVNMAETLIYVGAHLDVKDSLGRTPLVRVNEKTKVCWKFSWPMVPISRPTRNFPSRLP